MGTLGHFVLPAVTLRMGANTHKLSDTNSDNSQKKAEFPSVKNSEVRSSDRWVSERVKRFVLIRSDSAAFHIK